ncbi:unnamed protein product, partial [Rotaria sp. Silwood2]
LHLTAQTGVMIETLCELGAQVQWNKILLYQLEKETKFF